MKKFWGENKVAVFLLLFFLAVTGVSGGEILTTRRLYSKTTRQQNEKTEELKNGETEKQTNSQRMIIINKQRDSEIAKQEDKKTKEQKNGRIKERSASNDNQQIATQEGVKATEDKNEKTEEQYKNNIAVFLEIEDKKYQTNLPLGSSTYELMENLKFNNQLDFKGKNFSGLGFFVEEINGRKNDAGKNLYWIYYINNQPAKTGVTIYMLKNGDLITWKYEKPKF